MNVGLKFSSLFFFFHFFFYLFASIDFVNYFVKPIDAAATAAAVCATNSMYDFKLTVT